MTAQILDGKALAKTLRGELAERAAAFRSEHDRAPCLAAVLVGEDPASQVYVRKKEQECERVGIGSRMHRIPAETSQSELLDLVDRLNADPDVHGILVQLPLPDQIATQAVLDRIAPHKDVDAFHPENVGRLSQGRPRFLPCTPHGIVQLLVRNELPTSGRQVVVVGRSDIVGKPITLMLAQRDSQYGPDYANATVTLAHTKTRDLAEVVREADLVIAAVGRPDTVTGDMIKPGAIVIDVGINRTEAGLVGDVDFEAARERAAWITPVPGGVGPLTVAMLLHNTLAAAEAQCRKV